MKKVIPFVLMLLLAGFFSKNLSSQTDVLLSNSGLNADVFNPAYIENNGMINLQMLGRRQWVGFPDAPSAENMRISTFFDQQSMGLKFTVSNLQVGKEISRRINLAYIYKVYLNSEISLNFGLSAGLLQRQILLSQLIFQDIAEPSAGNDKTYYRPDFEFGWHLSNKEFSVGYAANHINSIRSEHSISRIPIHHHLYASYIFYVGEVNSIRPAISWHNQGNASGFQLDMQYFMNKINAGIGWRQTDAIILKAGLHATESLHIAYSYDMGIGRLANYNSGTHEFVIQWRLAKKNSAYLSPRFLDY